MKINDFTLEKMQIDYINNLIKIIIFLISGQTTLLGTVFKDYDHKWLAFIAILLMIFAVFLSYSIVENIIRKISPKPNFNKKLFNNIVNKLYLSYEAEWIRSLFSGVFMIISIFIYFIFIFQGI